MLEVWLVPCVHSSVVGWLYSGVFNQLILRHDTWVLLLSLGCFPVGYSHPLFPLCLQAILWQHETLRHCQLWGRLAVEDSGMLCHFAGGKFVCLPLAGHKWAVSLSVVCRPPHLPVVTSLLLVFPFPPLALLELAAHCLWGDSLLIAGRCVGWRPVVPGLQPRVCLWSSCPQCVSFVAMLLLLVAGAGLCRHSEDFSRVKISNSVQTLKNL